jgi:catechol 2,3-dioxygenase-like lactoylglutathione lyase family enzyme
VEHCTFALTMLGSSDLERSVRFYTEILGLRESGRFGGFVFFDTGATTLAVTQEFAAPAPGDHSHECVFGVPSVGQAYAALRDRIAFANEPRPVNAQAWAVNFRDPDGHHLSFYGPE